MTAATFGKKYQDPNDLVHARSGLMIFWHEWRLGKLTIDVAQNSLRLVKHEVAMLEQRYAAEGMLLEIFDALVLAGLHCLQTICRLLFLESHLDGSQKRAAGNAVNYDLAHALLVG
jgi:hypothetical protein